MFKRLFNFKNKFQFSFIQPIWKQCWRLLFINLIIMAWQLGCNWWLGLKLSLLFFNHVFVWQWLCFWYCYFSVCAYIFFDEQSILDDCDYDMDGSDEWVDFWYFTLAYMTIKRFYLFFNNLW